MRRADSKNKLAVGQRKGLDYVQKDSSVETDDISKDAGFQKKPSPKTTEGGISTNKADPTIIKDEDKSASNEAEDDIFNLKRLRLSQNIAEGTAVKKLIRTVPVRKPSPQDFVRARQGETWRLQTYVLITKEDKEVYIVEPSLWQELSLEITPMMLLTAINRQGVLFLWPIRLPRADGRLDNWNKSALDAAEMAQKAWVRLGSNLSLGAYELYAAQGELPEPEWPELSFEEIIRIAFKDNSIKDLDHPIVRRLWGLP